MKLEYLRILDWVRPQPQFWRPPAWMTVDIITTPYPRYSEEKSTSFKPNETKIGVFTISLPQQGSKAILVQAKIVSYHGMPVTFDEPASGDVMLEASKKVVLK